MSSVQSFNPNQAEVTVLPKAVKHIEKHLAETPNANGLLLTTKVAGCSGLTYVTEVVTEVEPDMIPATNEAGLAIYIAQKALAQLNGLTIDLISKELGQSQLSFINPNATGECGCKESFSVKTGLK